MSNEDETMRAQSVYYCFSRQAMQEQAGMAAHRAKQLGNVHASFREPSVFHAHAHGAQCGSQQAWGECFIIDPVSGDKTPFGSEQETK